ncbi:hypothetical protein [Bifidobacterium callitrichos]|uniref:hypothetical protein n=1 Tax=Bifidobacterium callitrichos TaxID=762209 RepID=UPI0011B27052|nr:hypothetical protein [Bifidobacterium callitrichos]
MIKPLAGSWFTVIVFSILPILPFEISVSHFFYFLIALSIISFYSKKTIVPSYFLIIATNVITTIIYTPNHNISSILMNTVIYASLLILPILCGLFLRYQLDTKDREFLLKSQQNNLKLARYLHDYTSNNLCDIILLTDNLLKKQSSEYTESIKTIRHLAFSSLEQIRSISKKLDNETIENESTIDNFMLELSKLCNKNQIVLSNLGIKGTILFPNILPSISSNEQHLVLDIIQEFCGNISKHADKQSGYVITITAHDDSIAITSTNAVASHQSKLSNGSGMQKIKERIELLHGSLTITNSTMLYKASISLPIYPA